MPRAERPSAVTVAAVDLGSNALRLGIARFRPGHGIEVLAEEREPVRLGREVFRTGELPDEARAGVLEALSRFGTLIRRLKPDAVRAVATAAVREASNYDLFLRQVKARTGIPLDVISGGEEARLLCLGVLGGQAAGDGESLVIDVGGGSAQIAVARGAEAVRAKSLPLGAVRLTEVFLKRDPPRKKELKLLRAYVREILRARLERDLVRRFPVAIACAGTAGAVAAMLRGEAVESGRTRVEAGELKGLLRELASRSIAQRAKLPGCDASRADVIVAGVAVLEGIADYLEVDALEISRRGLREGLIVDTLRRRGILDASDPESSLRAGLESFGRRCGVDLGHAVQVTRLALALFDRLERRVLEPTGRAVPAAVARRVLEAAAMLHDAGVFVSYARHHKHSAYLIANADLPGMTETEKALASNVARYHRRAHPRDRHPEFVVLPPEERLLVRRLAGILRIADGLDRTHDGRVKSVRLKARGTRLFVEVGSAKELELELWAARQKAALFREAFDVEIGFRAARRSGDRGSRRAARTAARIPSGETGAPAAGRPRRR